MLFTSAYANPVISCDLGKSIVSPQFVNYGGVTGLMDTVLPAHANLPRARTSLFENRWQGQKIAKFSLNGFIMHQDKLPKTASHKVSLDNFLH